jgi:hypothetical protein
MNNKKLRIEEFLIDIFDRIDIQTPSNFQEILDFVYNDLIGNTDSNNCDIVDVNHSFKKWVEHR